MTVMCSTQYNMDKTRIFYILIRSKPIKILRNFKFYYPKTDCVVISNNFGM